MSELNKILDQLKHCLQRLNEVDSVNSKKRTNNNNFVIVERCITFLCDINVSQIIDFTIEDIADFRYNAINELPDYIKKIEDYMRKKETVVNANGKLL